jgi:hypothetical protein
MSSRPAIAVLIGASAAVSACASHPPARERAPAPPADSVRLDLDGIATDTAGQPLPHSVMTLYATGADSIKPRTVIGKDDGRFFFWGLAPGEYRLHPAYIQRTAPDQVIHLTDRSRDTVVVVFRVRPFVIAPPARAMDLAGDTIPALEHEILVAARVSAIPALRASALPPGAREMRFWIGGGRVVPDLMLRLMRSGDSVLGQVMLYWNTMSMDDSLDLAAAEAYSHQARHEPECNVLHYGRDSTDDEVRNWITCVGPPTADARWRTLWRRLDSLGVWTLPDQSEVPQYKDLVSLDGTGLQVELRDGPRYRTYGHYKFSPAPESATAARIIDLVSRAARPSSFAPADSTR